MHIETDPAIAQAWQTLGDSEPKSLIDARLQAHWAAQVISAAGRTHLEERDDDSHTNLGWNEEHGVLTSREIGGHQAALRLADLTLLLLSADGKIVTEQPLAGWALDAAYHWLQQALKEHAGLDGELKRPTYDLPGHFVSEGGEFSVDSAALAELSRWYSDADLVLRKVTSWEVAASEVRCWPHHFDIATLIIEKEGDEETMSTIGIGMTPGDGSYDEPYFYCNPWPKPQYLERPMLHGEGFWHADEWFGAVLTGTRLIAAEPKDAQAHRVEVFIRSAISGNRSLLEGTFAKL